MQIIHPKNSLKKIRKKKKENKNNYNNLNFILINKIGKKIFFLFLFCLFFEEKNILIIAALKRKRSESQNI